MRCVVAPSARLACLDASRVFQCPPHLVNIVLALRQHVFSVREVCVRYAEFLTLLTMYQESHQDILAPAQARTWCPRGATAADEAQMRRFQGTRRSGRGGRYRERAIAATVGRSAVVIQPPRHR